MTNKKFRYEYVDMFEKHIFSALQKVVSDDITRLNMVSIRYNHVKDELFATDGYRFLLLRNCEEFELVFDRVKGDVDSYWTLKGNLLLEHDCLGASPDYQKLLYDLKWCRKFVLGCSKDGIPSVVSLVTGSVFNRKFFNILDNPVVDFDSLFYKPGKPGFACLSGYNGNMLYYIMPLLGRFAGGARNEEAQEIHDRGLADEGCEEAQE